MPKSDEKLAKKEQLIIENNKELLDNYKDNTYNQEKDIEKSFSKGNMNLKKDNGKHQKKDTLMNDKDAKVQNTYYYL